MLRQNIFLTRKKPSKKIALNLYTGFRLDKFFIADQISSGVQQSKIPETYS